MTRFAASFLAAALVLAAALLVARLPALPFQIPAAPPTPALSVNVGTLNYQAVDPAKVALLERNVDRMRDEYARWVKDRP